MLTFLQDWTDESQTITKEIDTILKKNNVWYDKNRIKWALTFAEANLRGEEVDSKLGQKAPLRQTHVILLEMRDDGRGFQPIQEEQWKDFHTKNIHLIRNFIRETMTTNVPDKVTGTNTGGINVLYPTSSGKHLQVIITNRGFIISASLLN